MIPLIPLIPWVGQSVPALANHTVAADQGDQIRASRKHDPLDPLDPLGSPTPAKVCHPGTAFPPPPRRSPLGCPSPIHDLGLNGYHRNLQGSNTACGTSS